MRSGLKIKETAKYFRRFALSVLCFLVVLGCCSWVTADEPVVPFWIVTERTSDDGMNGIVRDAVESFSARYPNVSVQLEILPFGTEARNRRVKELRELMEQGKGPDVFLLPTDYSVNTGKKIQLIDPLFSNIPYAMREGWFLDISEYYDKDTDLDKGALQQVVMDAGCVGEQRFLLPLSFDMNIFYFFLDKTDADLQTDMTAIQVLDYAVRSGNSLLAWALTDASSSRYRPEMVFSNLIDYDTGNVTLSFEEVERFFGAYQRLREKAEFEENLLIYPTLWSYFKSPASMNSLLPCYLSGLSHAVSFPVIASMEGKNLLTIPLRAENGAVTAMVNYFGAVSATTAYPKLAYEFLRSFLLPEYQWRVGVTGELSMEDWPVRVEGSIGAIWEQICSKFSSQETRRALDCLNASDEWVTQITDQVTRAEFRIDLNLANALNRLAKDE